MNDEFADTGPECLYAISIEFGPTRNWHVGCDRNFAIEHHVTGSQKARRFRPIGCFPGQSEREVIVMAYSQIGLKQRPRLCERAHVGVKVRWPYAKGERSFDLGPYFQFSLFR